MMLQYSKNNSVENSHIENIRKFHTESFIETVSNFLNLVLFINSGLVKAPEWSMGVFSCDKLCVVLRVTGFVLELCL